MWFKRVLLGYCAASLAVTIVTASNNKDATVSQRHHRVEQLIFPLLERRQQLVGNQTSSVEVAVSTSSDAISSSVFISSEISQTSTVVNTLITVITSESISSFLPFPTPSASGPDTTSSTPKSSNGDVTATSLRSTESTKPIGSSIEQQLPQTSTQVLSSSSQDATSKPSISSTIPDTTSVAISFTQKSSSLGSVEIATSAFSFSLEPTPVPTTAPRNPTSSDSTTSPSLASAPEPTERASQAQSDSTSTFPGNSVTSVSIIETKTSTPPAPTSQTFGSEMSSVVLSISTLPSESNSAMTTSIGQQPPSLLVSSVEASSTQISAIAIPVALFSGQTPTSSFMPASSISEVQSSSSSIVGTLSSIALESTTVTATSSAELTADVKTFSGSEEASSSLVFSAFEPNPTSVLKSETNTIEGTQPAFSTSFLTTSTITFSSLEQPTLSITAEQPLSSGIFETTQMDSDVSSSLAPPVATSDQLPNATPSSQPVTTESSSRLELSSVISKFLSSSSLSVTSESSAVSVDPTIGTQSSFFEAPTSLSSVIRTQNSPSPIETGPNTSLGANAISKQSVSSASTTSSLTPTPAPAPVGTDTSMTDTPEVTSTVSSSAMGLPTISLGSSILSSTTTAESGVVSSFLPSETVATSVVALTTSSLELSADSSQASSSFEFSTTQFDSLRLSFTTTSAAQLPSSSVVTASESEATDSQAPSISSPISSTVSSLTAPSGTSLSLSSVSSVSQALPSQQPTSMADSSINSTEGGAIPTSETAGSSLAFSSSVHDLSATRTFSGITTYAFSDMLISTSTVYNPLPSSVLQNGTQTTSTVSIISGTVTATFSTVYVSSAESNVLDLTTVAFSLLSSVTGAAVDQTDTRTSSAMAATTIPQGSGTHIPASESLKSSTKLGSGANSTWTSPLRPSLTATLGSPGNTNSTRTSTAGLGITFSHSALPTGARSVTAPVSNATQAEALQTSSLLVAVNPTTAGLFASTTSDSASSAQSDARSATSASSPDETSITNGASTKDTKTTAASHTPTNTSSQTAAAGVAPPLTTSQTAGVAVGATTGLLIAVVAAIFIARRYHAAKYGKRMSTGSIYPKVAYLYDPNTGGHGGDVEALMPSATKGPGGPASRVTQGSSNHMQRHSTGTMPVARFMDPSNPFVEAVRDPKTSRCSEYARINTARALSAAVAGHGGAARHSSAYAEYPSDVTNPFSDHVVPSSTFAPFSPDDIRRPEVRTPYTVKDGRGEYSRMSDNSYAYLNTAATIYPPVSPYGHAPTRGPSLIYDTRHQSIDSDPFADPFEHDLLLQVDERNRTSDSVTIFAPSPNLMSPRTPRAAVGPKLPFRQPNGMMSARSLLSPVAAKYLHKAHEVKIPVKSVASPVLVQVGRSPVIKPFSPPPAAPEPLGWEDIKRNSEKHFSNEQSVPGPPKFGSPLIKKKPVPIHHTRANPFLAGKEQALLASNGLPLTVKIPHRYSKSVGLDVPTLPRVHGRPDPAHEELSSDPIVREKRSRELRFADPVLIGKEF